MFSRGFIYGGQVSLFAGLLRRFSLGRRTLLVLSQVFTVLGRRQCHAHFETVSRATVALLYCLQYERSASELAAGELSYYNGRNRAVVGPAQPNDSAPSLWCRERPLRPSRAIIRWLQHLCDRRHILPESYSIIARRQLF